MRKAREPRPTFQKYVAYHGIIDHNGKPFIGIGATGKYHPKHGIQVFPACRIFYEDSEGTDGHCICRQPEQLVAQADTFLGIVVRVEQLLKREKAEASGTPSGPTSERPRVAPDPSAGPGINMWSDSNAFGVEEEPEAEDASADRIVAQADTFYDIVAKVERLSKIDPDTYNRMMAMVAPA
jgi:hypothetical protein